MNWKKLIIWCVAAAAPWVIIILCISAASASELVRVTQIKPPFCAILHDRNMECQYDLKFGPCTHWALLNYRKLSEQGKHPIYAVWKMSNGSWHMNVIFYATDNTLYAADNFGVMVPASRIRGILYGWEDQQRRWWSPQQ